MSNIIFLPNGQPHTVNNAASNTSGMPSRVMLKELATRDTVEWINRWISVLPNPDPVLEEHGEKWEVYESTMRDPRLFGMFENGRLNAVLSKEWEIVKARSSAEETKVIQQLAEKLINRNIISSILKAKFYGFQPIEILWNKSKYWLPEKMLPRPQRYFVYDTQNKLKLLTLSEPLKGIDVPEYKFIVPTYNDDFDHPYGRALLSICFWYIFLKKSVLQFWSIFTEDYGMPKIDGSFDPKIANTAKMEPQEFANYFHEQLIQMRQNGVITHMQGSEIKMLDNARSSQDIYESFIKQINTELSITILGHEGSSQSTPGRLGNDNTAMEVREDIVNADCKFIEDVFQQVFRMVHQLNFNGKDIPRLRFYQKDDIEQYKLKAEKDSTLALLGVKFNEKYIEEEYNIPKRYFTINNTPEQPKASENEQPEQNRTINSDYMNLDIENADTDFNTLEKFSDEIIKSKEFDEAFKEVYKPIFDLIEQTDDYNEMLKLLYDKYSEMNFDKLTELTSKFMAIARLYGDNQAQEDKNG